MFSELLPPILLVLGLLMGGILFAIFYERSSSKSLRPVVAILSFFLGLYFSYNIYELSQVLGEGELYECKVYLEKMPRQTTANVNIGGSSYRVEGAVSSIYKDGEVIKVYHKEGNDFVVDADSTSFSRAKYIFLSSFCFLVFLLCIIL